MLGFQFIGGHRVLQPFQTHATLPNHRISRIDRKKIHLTLADDSSFLNLPLLLPLLLPLHPVHEGCTAASTAASSIGRRLHIRRVTFFQPFPQVAVHETILHLSFLSVHHQIIHFVGGGEGCFVFPIILAIVVLLPVYFPQPSYPHWVLSKHHFSVFLRLFLLLLLLLRAFFLRHTDVFQDVDHREHPTQQSSLHKLPRLLVQLFPLLVRHGFFGNASAKIAFENSSFLFPDLFVASDFFVFVFGQLRSHSMAWSKKKMVEEEE